MTDLPRKADGGDDAGVEPDRGKSMGLAPWQKVVGIIGLIVVMLVVIGVLIGGGHTPPGLHGMGLP